MAEKLGESRGLEVSKISKKANYSRNFLETKSISAEQFSKIVESMDLKMEEGDFVDDKKLVSLIKSIQKDKLGFPAMENSKGQDGMLGPYTLQCIDSKFRLGKLKAEVKKNEPKEDPKKDYVESVDLETKTEQSMSGILKENGGTSELLKLSGNGNRPVAIYVPPGIDTSKPIEIVYHFHGTHSHLIDVPLPKLDGAAPAYRRKVGNLSVGRDRFTQAVETIKSQVAAGKRNTILVYSLSAGQRGDSSSVAHRMGYDNDWMKKGSGDSMQTLHSETLANLSKMGFKNLKASVTITGHSAGGIALTNIISSGFKADKVKYLDASYGYWLGKALKHADSKTDVQVYYRPNTATDKHDLSGATFTKSSKEHGRFISEFI